MLKGTMYITDDKDICINSINNPASILLTLEEGNSIFNLSNNNITKATILLPPPDVSIMAVDGNAELCTNTYYAYLHLPHVSEFIATIMMVLYRGGNIIIYYPKDEFSELFSGLLTNFFMITYGIMIGNRGIEYRYDPSFEPINLSTLYSNGFLSPNDFLKEYPVGVPISNELINKLINELGITIDETKYTTVEQMFVELGNIVYKMVADSKNNMIYPVSFIN